MTQPANSANISAKQNITLLRKLLTDPATNPAVAAQEWIGHAEQAGFKNQRMELKLLLGLLDRVAFPLSPTLQAYQIYYKGLLHELDNEVEKAEEYYKQGLTLAEQLPPADQVLSAFYHGGLSWCLRTRDEWQAAEKELLVGLKIAHQHNYKPALARLWQGLAYVYYKLGQMAEGIKYARQGIEVAHQIGDVLGEAANYKHLAMCLSGSGQLEEGLQALEQAATLQKSLGTTRDLGTIYLNLGVNYHELGNYKAAIESAELALTLATQNNHQILIRLALNNLSVYYTRQYLVQTTLPQAQKAMETSSRAAELFQTVGNSDFLAVATIEKAISYGLGGKIAQAHDYLAQAEEMVEQVRQHDNNIILAIIYRNLHLATLLLAQAEADYAKAFSYRDGALEMFGKMPDYYSCCAVLYEEVCVLQNSAQRLKYRQILLQSLQKWWELMQKLPAEELPKHVDMLLTLGELASEEDSKEQAFEIYSLAFRYIKLDKNWRDKRKLAEHYAKAAQLTTNDKALPLIEQALEILKAENSATEQVKELTSQLSTLRKQQSKAGKWFLGRH